MTDLVNLSLSVILSTIQYMESQVKRLMKGIPQTFTSVKGMGPVYAAGLIAKIGDIHRFDDHHALAKYADLVWTQNQSGKYDAFYQKKFKKVTKYQHKHTLVLTSRKLVRLMHSPLRTKQLYIPREERRA